MYFQPYPLGKWSWDWILWDQKSFFRRSKVEYNVFWTFNLMKNAAIRWSNHYCNLRSHEKGKKNCQSPDRKNFWSPVSISWNSASWPPVILWYFVLIDLFSCISILFTCVSILFSCISILFSCISNFRSYSFIFWSYSFVFLSYTFAFRSYFLSFIDLDEPPGSFWRKEI